MWETREIVQKMTWTLLKKRYSKKRKQQENKRIFFNTSTKQRYKNQLYQSEN